MKKIFLLLTTVFCTNYNIIAKNDVLHIPLTQEEITELDQLTGRIKKMNSSTNNTDTFKIETQNIKEKIIRWAQLKLVQLNDIYNTCTQTKLRKKIFYAIVFITTTITAIYGLDITLLLLKNTGMPQEILGYSIGTIAFLPISTIKFITNQAGSALSFLTSFLKSKKNIKSIIKQSNPQNFLDFDKIASKCAYKEWIEKQSLPNT
jgi:hypothetical protein